MTRRRRAREVVLQLLYEWDCNPGATRAQAEWFIEQRVRGQLQRRFAAELFDGVRRRRAAVDQHIARAASNWRLNRISPVDRSILRMAVFELLFRPEVPPRVAMDEAIELAKRYGSADSPRFVNGVLDRVWADHAAGHAGHAQGPSTEEA